MLSRRLFSTSRSAFEKAKLTQLPNGLTIASQKTSSPTSSIGLYLNAGSRAENPFNSGVSHLLGNALAHSSDAKAALKSGVKIQPYNAKEVSGIVSSFAPGNSKESINALTAIVSNFDKITSDAAYIKEQVAYSTKISEIFEETPKKMVVEHMIATAFQGTSLALPTYGKADTLSTLETMDIINFAKKQFLASNIAIVATGSDIVHEDLVSFASKLTLKTGSKPAVEPYHFLGSDVRLRDDTLPSAYIALSAKVNTYGSDDFYTGLVASSVNGSYSTASIYSNFEGSKLAQFLTENHLINEFEHFQLNFSDVALWGAYWDTSNIGNVDETIHFSLKDWNRYSIGTLNETELTRAKANLKFKLLNKTTQSSIEAANSLANDLLVKRFIESEEEISKSIDAVTLSSISKWAQAHLYDQDIALAGTGQIEALFDYNRIRNDMSMMRW